jgi:putative ABC transport system ATP-binding protein
VNDRVAIRVERLSKEFTFGGQRVQALREVSFSVETGTMVSVVGPSGSGKTTLVNVLGGLDSPTAGEVWVEGRPIHVLREADLTEFRRRRVGFVFQAYNLIPGFSALENVGLPLEFDGTPRRRREERARECLELVGLPPSRHRHTAARLSGGEQQRVAVARALANDPAFILADEPTGNLDSANSEIIVNLLASLAREQGKTVVMVTHDRSLAARAERVFEMVDGRIL